MPHSLRAKLSGLRYKGILEDKDYKRLCKALDNENVLDKIRAEIEGDMLFYEEDNCNDKDTGFVMGLQHTLDIIDKHTK